MSDFATGRTSLAIQSPRRAATLPADRWNFTLNSVDVAAIEPTLSTAQNEARRQGGGRAGIPRFVSHLATNFAAAIRSGHLAKYPARGNADGMKPTLLSLKLRRPALPARSPTAPRKNLRALLTEPRYADYVPQVVEHVAAEKWSTLDDVFWTVIPFGTGGRRGKMYPIGSNAINDRTIGESAQGLAEYVREHGAASGPLSCAIAYDTRHRSRDFAELCAEIMVANGFTVYFLDGYRSTPELSFAVRMKRCSCGIMVTASHNPPSDNAVKAYWSTARSVASPARQRRDRSRDERANDPTRAVRSGGHGSQGDLVPRRSRRARINRMCWDKVSPGRVI